MAAEVLSVMLDSNDLPLLTLERLFFARGRAKTGRSRSLISGLIHVVQMVRIRGNANNETASH